MSCLFMENKKKLKQRLCQFLLSKLIASQVRQGIVHVLRCLSGQIFAWKNFLRIDGLFAKINPYEIFWFLVFVKINPREIHFQNAV